LDRWVQKGREVHHVRWYLEHRLCHQFIVLVKLAVY
jgi:hypothetical protein